MNLFAECSMEKEKKKEYRKIAGMLAGILLLLTAAGALLGRKTGKVRRLSRRTRKK